MYIFIKLTKYFNLGKRPFLSPHEINWLIDIVVSKDQIDNFPGEIIINIQEAAARLLASFTFPG